MNQWEPCPHCHSERVVPRGKEKLFAIGAFVTIAFILLGVYHPLLGIGAIIGIIIMILAPLRKPTFTCQDCHFQWRAEK
ncbi:hypothetical protein [Rubeoparvulum massiliense]|uniref:hypothetical protein n=1 Tax=Rubeoparvulum massiliense TaxID=1631346 RepID=UPI00065E86D5|nr:hypothetical protein [Rubeoparvulum massiliense]